MLRPSFSARPFSASSLASPCFPARLSRIRILGPNADKSAKTSLKAAESCRMTEWILRTSSLVEDWHRARSRRDAAERRLDARIDRWLTKELAEARTEVREAQTEVVESRQEVRSEQGDAQRAARRGNARQAQQERRSSR